MEGPSGPLGKGRVRRRRVALLAVPGGDPRAPEVIASLSLLQKAAGLHSGASHYWVTLRSLGSQVSLALL